MLYTPHARVFLSAVPIFSGSSITGYMQVEDPRMSARLWEFTARDQARQDAKTPGIPAALLRLTGIRRQASPAQAA